MTSKLDLLIVDIDNTFIYHRTVAAANRLFLKFLLNKRLEDRLYTTGRTILVMLMNLHRLRPNRKVLKLMWTGTKLYFVDAFRRLNNRFFKKLVSCERMIRIWAEAVVSMKIKADDYRFSEKVIKENLNQKVMDIYSSVRQPDTKVVAITEHFATGEDPIKKVLGIDVLESNKFIIKNGTISGYVLNIKNKKDKKRFAEQYKGKNIGIIIEDYDEKSLLKLKNLKFIAYTKKLKRFIDKKKNIRLIEF